MIKNKIINMKILHPLNNNDPFAWILKKHLIV